MKRKKTFWISYYQYDLDDPEIIVFDTEKTAKDYLQGWMISCLAEDKVSSEEINEHVAYFLEHGYFHIESSRYIAFVKEVPYYSNPYYSNKDEK